MGYAHIENLYRPEAQKILDFKWVWALEKIHGTSAHLAWRNGTLAFFAGGAKHEEFVKLFDETDLRKRFQDLGHEIVTVFGEAYGGKMQGMSATYGKQLKFIAFDVNIGKVGVERTTWLNVPDAEKAAISLGLEFVHYRRISTERGGGSEGNEPTWLNAERDAPSEQAFRNGCADRNDLTTWKRREGVVLRPPFEVTLNNGERLCAKHKITEFCERKTEQKVDEKQRAVLEAAEAIADEWVTPRRLEHVLDKLGNPDDLSAIPKVIEAMIEDVTREGSGEIVDSKQARKAISARTVQLFKDKVCRI
jgi:hypothetical protein